MKYYMSNTLLVREMVVEDCAKLAKAFIEQHKPLGLFETYFQQQEAGSHLAFVASWNGTVTGYALLLPQALAGPYAQQAIPEIKDFNVLPSFQGQGIGSTLMDVAESCAREHAPAVCLAVGLHAGYGTAQRMYIKRGYIPDGTGVWYQDKPLEPYTSCQNDDELVL